MSIKTTVVQPILTIEYYLINTGEYFVFKDEDVVYEMIEDEIGDLKARRLIDGYICEFEPQQQVILVDVEIIAKVKTA